VSPRLTDGLLWIAVGVSLLSQAGFLIAMSWWPAADRLPSDGIPPAVAGYVVAFALGVVGTAALALGVRRARRPHHADARGSSRERHIA
jgi:hypothetical protein